MNAIIPPLALHGSVLTIRKFSKDPYTAKDLINFGTWTVDLVTVMEACVRGKLNILVSGGTGTGKTTNLNVLSAFIPDGERIITIEDSAELQLQQPHVINLETRLASAEGTGRCRSATSSRTPSACGPTASSSASVAAEALDMLQAMNTGHEGSMTTVHANTRDAISRLETMVPWRATSSRCGRSASRSPRPSTSSSRSPACPTVAASSPRSPRCRAWRATSSCRTSSATGGARRRRKAGGELVLPASAEVPRQAHREQRRGARLRLQGPGRCAGRPHDQPGRRRKVRPHRPRGRRPRASPVSGPAGSRCCWWAGASPCSSSGCSRAPTSARSSWPTSSTCPGASATSTSAASSSTRASSRTPIGVAGKLIEQVDAKGSLLTLLERARLPVRPGRVRAVRGRRRARARLVHRGHHREPRLRARRSRQPVPRHRLPATGASRPQAQVRGAVPRRAHPDRLVAVGRARSCGPSS